MKKLCYFATIILMNLILFCMPVHAASGLEFELKFTGEVIKNQTKEANVILRGTNATMYSKVRVKVEVTGPGTPKILATDSAGNEIDIAKTGYWGPPEGFPVGGTFENITPVKVTFNTAGTYEVKLSLVNVENGETEIFNKTETIKVLETSQINNTVPEGNNTIEKLPETGTSIFQYVLYAGLLLAILVFGYHKINIANNK